MQFTFFDQSDLSNLNDNERRELILDFLKVHHQSFHVAHDYAESTGQPTPSDTAAWSQILASIIHGVPGLQRKKGQDLSDGSDVKAANTWKAIDTPRFNGVIKAGTKSKMSGNMDYLDNMPYLYFVLWDYEPNTGTERCRVWCVRPDTDPVFRQMCADWYEARRQGEITSSNFQLHPPRGKNSNVIRNTYGNLEYPLILRADWDSDSDEFNLLAFNLDQIEDGRCVQA